MHNQTATTKGGEMITVLCQLRKHWNAELQPASTKVNKRLNKAWAKELLSSFLITGAQSGFWSYSHFDGFGVNKDFGFDYSRLTTKEFEFIFIRWAYC